MVSRRPQALHVQQLEPRCVLGAPYIAGVRECRPANDAPLPPALRDEEGVHARAARPADGPLFVVAVDSLGAAVSREANATHVRPVPVLDAARIRTEVLELAKAEALERPERHRRDREDRRCPERARIEVGVDRASRSRRKGGSEIERLPNAPNRTRRAVPFRMPSMLNG